MRFRTILNYLWRLPLCGISFFIGMAVGGGLLPLLGFEAPAMPEGTDANTILIYFLFGSMLLAIPLSWVSEHLKRRFIGRWLILAALTWVIGAVSMVLESAFFMETGAVSSSQNTLYTILNFLLPSLALSGLVAAFFRPPLKEIEQKHRIGDYSRHRSFSAWLWRVGVALIAYPVVYIVFGLLVEPFVMDYYTIAEYELAAPTWEQLIPLQLVRSVLFLLVCLPVLIWWNGSKRTLWFSLGAGFFLLTAFMAVITAYWFPWQLRFFHGLELFADGVFYTGVLVWLLSDPS